MIVMDLQIGKIYDINSRRKGKFRIKLISQSQDFASGIIIKGKAKAILSYNEVYEGEIVGLRKELTTFTEVK